MDRQEQEGIDESLAEIMQESEWGQEYGTGGLEEYNENLLEQIRVDTFSEPTRTDEEDVVANLGDDFYAQFNDVGQGGAVRDFTQGLLCSLQTEENEPGQVQAEENEPEQGLGGTKPIRKVYGPYAGPRKCQHNRRKDQCKECGGSQICEHGRLRPRCRDCKGSQICEHGRDKAYCRDCKGSQICSHGKNKASCWDCGGARFCMHGRQKRECPECKQLKRMVRECKQLKQMVQPIPQAAEPEQGLGGFEGGTYASQDFDVFDNQGSEVVIDSDEESMKQILSDVRRRPMKQRRNIKDFVDSVNVAAPGEPLQCQHGNTPPATCQCWNGVCKHGIFKCSCRECGMSRFCKHGKYKTRCSQCKALLDTNNNDGGFGAPPPQKPRKQ